MILDGLTEEELYESFGLEKPEEPEEEPGAQEPTEEPTEEPGNQEPTEEPEEEPGAQEPTEKPTEEPQRVLTGQQPQRDQAAIDRAYAQAYAGKANPYTGKPIMSQADYEEYMRMYRADLDKRHREALEKAGIDPDIIRQMVDEHPAIQQAQQVIQKAQEDSRRAQEQEARSWYEGQLKQINTLDPEAKVTSLEDLQKKDPGMFQAMMGQVSRGVSLVDAYKLANFDRLSQKRAAAAKQAARNQAAGKAHLIPAGGQGESPETVEVPPAVRQQYKALNPGMTDEQIQKEYAQYLKETGL